MASDSDATSRDLSRPGRSRPARFDSQSNNTVRATQHRTGRSVLDLLRAGSSQAGTCPRLQSGTPEGVSVEANSAPMTND